MKYVSALFAILFFLASCDHEGESLSPSLQSPNVIITLSKTILQGSITSAVGKNISDHGFVWGTSPVPVLENSFVKSLGPLNTDKVFLAEINAALLSHQTYYFRTFYIMNGQTTYGEIISFEVLLDKLPAVESFAPAQATWNDTISIKGSNFSLDLDENKIQFGTVNAICVEASETQLKVVVPDLNVSKVLLSVTVFNYRSISKDTFQLSPPFIASFTPTRGSVNTQVTISGNNFKQGITNVYFNSLPADIISISTNEIIAKVPGGLPANDVSLGVEVASQRANASSTFLSTALILTDFLPPTGTFDDEITLKGSGFSSVITNNKVKFGDTEALVTEVSDQYIKIIVPRDLKKQKSKITIDNGNESVVSFNDFVLNAPVLTEFSPQTGTFGNTIIISGQNFNPVPEFNGVVLGLAPAVVKEATSAKLTIEVPEDYNALDGKSKITVTTSGGKVESLADFDLSLHTIASFTPINGNRDDILTLTGQNFNPVADKNVVYIGSARATIISASTMAISFTVPSSTARGNHFVRLRVGGREVTANQTFFSNDPWSIKADMSGGGRKYAVAFNVAGKGYVVGGLDNQGNYKNELLQYDPINNEWIKLNDIPVNGEGMVAFATATKGYILFHKELWQYDPGKNQWQKKARFPGFAGRFQSAFSIGESGYVGAGVSAELYSSMPTNEFYEYQETTDQWFARKSFPPGGMQWGVGFSAGDKGFFALGSWTHRDIWEYKPANDTWEKQVDLLNIVHNINLMRLWAVGVSGNSKAYFGTGSDDTAIWMERFNDLYEYDPVTNTCKRVEDMPALGRTQAFGFSIGDKVYIGGGSGYSADDGIMTAFPDFFEYQAKD